MQESRFERDVQQQLDELRLRPSVNVWSNLEQILRRRKRRRVLLLFSVMAGLLMLGSAGYFLLHQPTLPASASRSSLRESSTPVGSTPDAEEQRSVDRTSGPAERKTITGSADRTGASTTTEVASAPVNRNSPKPVTTRVATPPTNDEAAGAFAQGRSAGSPGAGQEGKLVSSGTGYDNQKKTTTSIAAMKQHDEQEVTSGIAGSQSGTKVITGGRTGPGSIGSTIGKETPVTDSSALVISNEALVTDSSAPVITNEASVTDSAAITIAKTTSVTDSAVAGFPKAKLAGKRRLRFAIDISNGRSDLVETPEILPASQAAPTMQFAAGNSVFNPAAAPIYYPGDMKGGFSFSLGGSMMYDVIPRVRLTTGLSYAYYSNQVDIGRPVSGYYARNSASLGIMTGSTGSGTAVNRFHYLQMPLRVGFLIAAAAKNPVELNAGVNAQYLVATNALQFRHQYANAYYRDKADLNRFAMSLAGGLNWNIGAGSAFSWSVGPEFSLALKPWTSKTEDPRDRLFYLGLHGRIFLPAKK